MPPRLKSFAPVATPEARILILGTMPSVTSLQRQEYYGFAHNVFWPIMAELLGFDRGLEYAARCDELRNARIALWDVLASCHRQGSLDSNIESERPNNFPLFFRRHPKIKNVYFNGGPAKRLFRKHVIERLPQKVLDRLAFVLLPSTSPANAGMPLEQKLEVWRQITEQAFDS